MFYNVASEQSRRDYEFEEHHEYQQLISLHTMQTNVTCYSYWLHAHMVVLSYILRVARVGMKSCIPTAQLSVKFLG